MCKNVFIIICVVLVNISCINQPFKTQPTLVDDINKMVQPVIVKGILGMSNGLSFSLQKITNVTLVDGNGKLHNFTDENYDLRMFKCFYPGDTLTNINSKYLVD